MGIKDIRNVS